MCNPYLCVAVALYIIVMSIDLSKKTSGIQPMSSQTAIELELCFHNMKLETMRSEQLGSKRSFRGVLYIPLFYLYF